jgi:UDP-N-acetylglucosamine 2-epimerase
MINYKYNLSLGKVEMIPLLAYKEYLDTIYNSKFIISDSGTGQEEPALLGTHVIVPRDFTERPQSYDNNCSIKLKINDSETNFEEVFNWIDKSISGEISMNIEWLGDGNTSKLIVNKLNDYLHNNVST